MLRCFGRSYRPQINPALLDLAPESGISWVFHAGVLQLAQYAILRRIEIHTSTMETLTYSKHQFRPPASTHLLAHSSIRSSRRGDVAQTDAIQLLSQPILSLPLPC